MHHPALSPPDGAYRRTIIGGGPASPSAVRARLQGVFRPIGRGEARSTELALSDAGPVVAARRVSAGPGLAPPDGAA